MLKSSIQVFHSKIVGRPEDPTCTQSREATFRGIWFIFLFFIWWIWIW